VPIKLRMRGKPIQEADDQEIDADYWAKAAQAAADVEPGMDTDNPMPFSTQFFDDDDDVPGFDDGFEAPVALSAMDDGEQDLLTGSQAPARRVKPEFVNYAKRAKRVDVRRLKENIWRGLDIVVKEEDADEDAMEADEQPARPFGDVVSGLRTQYPKERMDEISTSFCFICLLHLANEKGLKLEVGEDGVLGAADGDVDGAAPAAALANGDKRVGELWGLKVRHMAAECRSQL
jgi:condensin complex subunit 2